MDPGQRMGIKISASIGDARFPEHGNICEELLAAADNAMYNAKRAKSNPVQVSRVLASSNG
jgi:GGDEF domain-containing protein